MSLRTCRMFGLLGIGFLAAATVARAQSPAQPATRPSAGRQQQLIEKYDRDGDGRLGPEERQAIRQDVRDGKLEVPQWFRRQWQQRRRRPPADRPQPGRLARFQDQVAFDYDVEYGMAGKRSLKLDLLKPKQPSADPLPAVVFIHGGGWRGGNKRSAVLRLAPLVAGGDYVGVSVGYRLSGEATWPAQIHDCKTAIRWIRANAEQLGVDPKRIGVWGASAGGHLVNMLGTSGDLDTLKGDCGSPEQSDRVTCVVSFCGPADFLAPKELEGGRHPSAVEQLLGGDIEDKQDVAREASPITYVSDDDPPFLLVHGDNDPIVPYQQAERFSAALEKAGVDVTLLTVQGGGHGIGTPEVIRRVNLFFARHLCGENVELPDEPIDGTQPFRGPPPAQTAEPPQTGPVRFELPAREAR